MSRRRLFLLVICGAIAPMCASCRDRDEAPKYRDLTGRVTAINVSTGEVEMSAYIEKMKKEQVLKGKLAPDAEILINGKTAQLEDVRIDDQVKVVGRVEKRNGEPQLVATKVSVTRADATSAPAATQPTSKD